MLYTQIMCVHECTDQFYLEKLQIVIILLHSNVWEQSFLKYPRTVGIVSIHFINPVSRVVFLISCNTGPNKGNTNKTKMATTTTKCHLSITLKF